MIQEDDWEECEECRLANTDRTIFKSGLMHKQKLRSAWKLSTIPIVFFESMLLKICENENEYGIAKQWNYHIVEQSKLISMNLLGLMLKLIAYSIPSISGRNSGQIIALPPYAPSTWSHKSFSWQTGPISDRTSKEQQDVVPSVVETKNGIKPRLRSSWKGQFSH